MLSFDRIRRIKLTILADPADGCQGEAFFTVGRGPEVDGKRSRVDSTRNYRQNAAVRCIFAWFFQQNPDLW